MTDSDVRDRPREKRALLSAALIRGPVEVLDFFLPLWAGVALGASAGQVGALTAIEALVSLLVRPLAGIAADRWERRHVAMVGAVLYALSLAGYAATPTLPPAYLAAVAGGAGGALFWVALRAIIGEWLARDGAVYSRLLVAEGTATWIAFVAAMSLVGRIDYRGVFALGAVACLLATVVLAWAPAARPDLAAPAPPSLARVARRLRPMLVVVALTATAEAGVALLLLLHLQRHFALELNQIALVFLPGFVVFTVLPPYLHRVVLRAGRARVLAVALLAGAVLAAGLAVAPNPGVIAALWVLSAASLAAAIPVEQSVVAEAADGSLGRGMGLYESATLVGGVAGPLAAGLLYQAGGWRWACLLAAVVLVGGAVAVPRAMRRVGVADRPATPPTPASTALPADNPTTPPAPASTTPPADTAASPAVPVPAPVPGSAPPAPAWAAAIVTERRRWLAHLGLFLALQIVLALFDRSWPYAALRGELSLRQVLNGDTSGLHWLLQGTRIWTLVMVGDTLWCWGRIALLWWRR